MKPRSGGLAAVLAEQGRRYCRHIRDCRRRCDETHVHDVRTCARRLLSLLELYCALRPHIRLGKLRQAIKRQLDALDELRDTQVMLIAVADSLRQLPGLAVFHDHLRRRERQLLAQTAAYLRDHGTGPIRRKLNKAERRCRRRLADCDLNAEITGILAQLVAVISARRAVVDPQNPATIHHLRIAVKKLRYTLAAVHSLLPEFPQQQYQDLPEYLSLMGDIQNSVVLEQALAGFYGASLPAEIREHCLRQRRELLDAFQDYRPQWL